MASGGEVQMMACGWRRKSLGGAWRQAVWGLVMGLCVGVVAGAPVAMQPSSSSGDNGAGGEVGCERPITDVMWGFGFTLLATFVAIWNTSQHMFEGKLVSKLVGSLILTFLTPLVTFWVSFGNTFMYVPMICHLLKMEKEEITIGRMYAMLSPWSESPTRFLVTCDIIMYVQKGEDSKLIKQSWMWSEKIVVEDETEVMVIGEEPDENTKKNYYERKELTRYGKVALLWGEYFSSDHEKFKILPKYGQLKFLRANSGFAVIAIGIQAIGYIYAVMFRNLNGLRVAPIEVIGLVINILLLIGVILYGTSNACARPLVIYMNQERERKFLDVLKSRPKQDFEVNLGFAHRVSNSGLIITVVFICIPILLYFIISLKKATNTMVVVPLIIFAISLLLRVLLNLIINIKTQLIVNVLILSIICITAFAHVWAVIVTFYYWNSQHFNTRPQLINYSQFIPFIG